MLTLNDIRDKLKQIDEVSVLEILDIHSDELVNRFPDKIEERYEYLQEELGEEDDD